MDETPTTALPDPRISDAIAMAREAGRFREKARQFPGAAAGMHKLGDIYREPIRSLLGEACERAKR